MGERGGGGVGDSVPRDKEREGVEGGGAGGSWDGCLFGGISVVDPA